MTKKIIINNNYYITHETDIYLCVADKLLSKGETKTVKKENGEKEITTDNLYKFIVIKPENKVSAFAKYGKSTSIFSELSEAKEYLLGKLKEVSIKINNIDL
jgi:hypothetical protein